MQEQDESTETPAVLNDTANVSRFQVWEQRIAIFVMELVLVEVLFISAWFIHVYLTHTPAIVKLLMRGYTIFRPCIELILKPWFELLVYGSAFGIIFNYLAEVVSSRVSQLVSTKQQRLNYLSFIGVVLLFFLFELVCSHKEVGSNLWVYFSIASIVISLISMAVATYTSTKNALIYSTLSLISYIIIFIGVVLSFFTCLKRLLIDNVLVKLCPLVSAHTKSFASNQNNRQNSLFSEFFKNLTIYSFCS